jgi:hypothetical protein
VNIFCVFVKNWAINKDFLCPSTFELRRAQPGFVEIPLASTSHREKLFEREILLENTT